MSSKSDSPIAALLFEFKRLTGLQVVWKNALGSLVEGQDPYLSYHRNPFCTAVKKNAERMKRCVLDCVKNPAHEASAHKGHFIRLCHAGGMEVIVPLYMSDRLAGILFWGPFRTTNGSCPYEACKGKYVRLEKFNKTKADATGSILSLMGNYLIETQEAMRLKNLGNKQNDPRINSLMTYCNSNLEHNLSVDTLAARAYLSRSRLQHLFKQQTGMTISDYIMVCRMVLAQQLLRNSDERLYSVALSVGYQSYSAFSTVFKRYSGLGPLEFKRRHQSLLNP